MGENGRHILRKYCMTLNLKSFFTLGYYLSPLLLKLSKWSHTRRLRFLVLWGVKEEASIYLTRGCSERVWQAQG